MSIFKHIFQKYKNYVKNSNFQVQKIVKLSSRRLPWYIVKSLYHSKTCFIVYLTPKSLFRAINRVKPMKNEMAMLKKLVGGPYGPPVHRGLNICYLNYCIPDSYELENGVYLRNISLT